MLFVIQNIARIGIENHWNQRSVMEIGAQGETRTPTYISTLAPEASASTNSATWARKMRTIHTEKKTVND